MFTLYLFGSSHYVLFCADSLQNLNVSTLCLSPRTWAYVIAWMAQDRQRSL